MMIRNYMIVSLRNLRRHPGYTLVNVAGLAVGFACVILIGLYLKNELSYDQHHAKANRTYRVIQEIKRKGEEIRYTGGPSLIGRIASLNVPGVETAVRRFTRPRVPVAHNGQIHYTSISFTDTTFFEVFDFVFLAGDPKTALMAPVGMVITRSTAERMFQKWNAVGETVSVEHRYCGGTWTVTGVVEDPPPNSMIQFDMISAVPQQPRSKGAFFFDWSDGPLRTYLVLQSGTNPDVVADQLKEALIPLAREEFREEVRFHLQLLPNVYLETQARFGIGRANLANDLRSKGSPDVVLMYGAAAVLILLVAVINYVNLATVRSTARSQEVALRKVVGAQRSQLMGQFIGESMVQAIVAASLAVLLSFFILDGFNSLIDKRLSLALFGTDEWIMVVCAILAVGFLSGFYPAIITSSIPPARILSGITVHRGSTRLRQLLVIWQFSVCIALVVGTIVIARQMNYMVSKDLGFHKDFVVVLPLERHPIARNRWGVASGLPDAARFKTQLVAHPNIASVGLFNYFTRSGETGPVTVRGKTLRLRLFSGNVDFFEMMDFKILQGRGIRADIPLSERGEIPSEGLPFLVNESAARLIGGENLIGESLRWGRRTGQIVGVFANFNDGTLREPVQPMFFIPNFKSARMAVRLVGNDIPGAIAHIRQTWQALIPSYPFEYWFLDEIIGNKYQHEQRVQALTRWFTILSLFVSAMGLFGLAVLSVARRKKEIGIRKAIGASTQNIFTLLLTEHLKLVVLANLIAGPCAWYFSDQWLAEFAYRTDLTPMPFVVGAAMTLVVALGTVVYQVITASKADPVEALKEM